MLSYLKISSSSRLIISNRRVISSSILFDLHPLSVTKVKATYAINNYPIGTMNWEQVKEVVYTNRLELLGRNPQQQEVYEKVLLQQQQQQLLLLQLLLQQQQQQQQQLLLLLPDITTISYLTLPLHLV